MVVDDQSGTITFHLREPNPDFLSLLALPFGMVVPAGQPPAAAAAEPPPGTGPYIVKTYVPGERLMLTRNPHFKLWSADAQPDGYPDRIDWRLGVDAETQVARSSPAKRTSPRPGFHPRRSSRCSRGTRPRRTRTPRP